MKTVKEVMIKALGYDSLESFKLEDKAGYDEMINLGLDKTMVWHDGVKRLRLEVEYLLDDCKTMEDIYLNYYPIWVKIRQNTIIYRQVVARVGSMPRKFKFAWNIATATEEACQYSSRRDFSHLSSGAYKYITKHAPHLMNEIFGEPKSKSGIYVNKSNEELEVILDEYKSRSHLIQTNQALYRHLMVNNKTVLNNKLPITSKKLPPKPDWKISISLSETKLNQIRQTLKYFCEKTPRHEMHNTYRFGWNIAIECGLLINSDELYPKITLANYMDYTKHYTSLHRLRVCDPMLLASVQQLGINLTDTFTLHDSGV